MIFSSIGVFNLYLVVDVFVVIVKLAEMADVAKLLYIVVMDEEVKNGKESFRYTKPVLLSTLQLMGCKARHAFKVHVDFFVVNLMDEFVICLSY